MSKAFPKNHLKMPKDTIRVIHTSTIYEYLQNIHNYKNLKKSSAILDGCHNINKPTKDILNIYLLSSSIPLYAFSRIARQIEAQMAVHLHHVLKNLLHLERGNDKKREKNEKHDSDSPAWKLTNQKIQHPQLK